MTSARWPLAWPERFWVKVDRRGPDECWPWLASVSKGYGIIMIPEGPTRPAHRVAYEMEVGPIPPGLQIDHVCHTRAVERGECTGGDSCIHRRCVNPAHLEVVTHAENGARSVQGRKPRCHRGHPFDEANTYYTKPGNNVRRICRRCHADRQARYNAERRRDEAAA